MTATYLDHWSSMEFIFTRLTQTIILHASFFGRILIIITLYNSFCNAFSTSNLLYGSVVVTNFYKWYIFLGFRRRRIHFHNSFWLKTQRICLSGESVAIWRIFGLAVKFWDRCEHFEKLSTQVGAHFSRTRVTFYVDFNFRNRFPRKTLYQKCRTDRQTTHTRDQVQFPAFCIHVCVLPLNQIYSRNWTLWKIGNEHPLVSPEGGLFCIM